MSKPVAPGGVVTPANRMKMVLKKTFEPGVILATQQAIYEVLDNGTYGDKFRVRRECDREQSLYLMVEKSAAREEDRYLVYAAVMADEFEQKAPLSNDNIFLPLDKGNIDNYVFAIMPTYVRAPDLFEKLDAEVEGKMDRSTRRGLALRIAVQTLAGLSALHRIGWLHRAIRPSVVYFGAEKWRGRVFISEFLTAAPIDRNQHVSANGITLPQTHILNPSSLKFSSRRCDTSPSACQRMSVKDDLEAWFWMIHEYFGTNPFTPTRLMDAIREYQEPIDEMEAIHRLKRGLMGGLYNSLIRDIAVPELIQIADLIMMMKPDEVAPFAEIDALLKLAAARENVNPFSPPSAIATFNLGRFANSEEACVSD